MNKSRKTCHMEFAVRPSLLIMAAGFWAAMPFLLGGCGQSLRFPAQTVSPSPSEAGVGGVKAFDTAGDGRADFFMYPDNSGRITRIAYKPSGKQSSDAALNLDSIPFGDCRHLVIILDGFGYGVIKRYYDEGHLRVFYPPSRVIAPYPTLTDTSLEDVFNYIPCAGYEAQYFDCKENCVRGGAGSYLAGADEPYRQFLQYRASILWDAVSYLEPWAVFKKEVNDVISGFEHSKKREYIAYFVSSAGMGTAHGEEGQRQCLERVERMINQAIWQTHGKIKITMFADHGHSYTPSEPVSVANCLKSKGWRLGSKLAGDRDVVLISFGLVTYISIDAKHPDLLAADVVGCPGVDLVSYTDGDAVVIMSADGGKAKIRRAADRYSYETISGDPLKLKPILATLKADDKGYYGADDMFAATADHEYPAPLERLWRGHFALVDHPTSVLVSLKDNYYAGSTTFSGAVKVASTHGSLNRKNSTTFVMSTAAPLPPLMRSREVHKALSAMIGEPWPMGK